MLRCAGRKKERKKRSEAAEGKLQQSAVAAFLLPAALVRSQVWNKSRWTRRQASETDAAAAACSKRSTLAHFLSVC
jgi:hypothetical protein